MEAIFIILIGTACGLIVGVIVVAVNKRSRLRRRSTETGRQEYRALIDALEPEQKAKIKKLVEEKEFIRVIKQIRNDTGMSLKDARRLIDGIRP